MATPPPLDRRDLLRLALAAAVPAPWPRWAGAQPRLPDNPFRLGVASGSPQADSVVLWTRLLGDGLGPRDLAVRWEIADDEGFARVVARGQSPATAALAHAVHVEAGGLAPDRWYFYRFHAGEWTSPTGRTRTLPREDAAAARLRLAYASCQRWEHGYFAAWRHLRAEQPDLVLFLGDYIYEYPTALGAVRTPDGVWASSLEDFRRRHALYKSDADLQAMHAACPWLFTWDDHEVQNDYAGLQAGNGGPPVGDFAARRAVAYQAYYEHQPLRAAVLTRSLQGLAEGAELRLYSSCRFGTLASLCLLDARQYRDPQACTRGDRLGASVVNPLTCPQWEDPGRTLLGAAQERWLDDRMAAAGGAAWTVLGQATLFGRRDNQAGPGEALWNDGWDGYPAARARLLASLQRHAAPNPVILGGDVHENWVGHVKADYARPDSAAIGVEFCGTSISSRAGGADRTAERLAENPHFVFADALHRGYGLAEFTPQRLQVSLRGIADARDPDAGVKTLARFRVEAGRPRLEMA